MKHKKPPTSGASFGTTFQNSTTHIPEFRKDVHRGKEHGKHFSKDTIVPLPPAPTAIINSPAVDFPGRRDALRTTGPVHIEGRPSKPNRPNHLNTRRGNSK
jgi:hypothetical protein